MTKRKNNKLEWYAFREDFNKNELERVNVLGIDFAKELLKRIKQDKISSYNELKELIKRMLMYRYWSKAEHEVLVTSLHHRPDRDNVFKIDVWYQLEKNLDRITEYVMKELQIDFNNES